MSRLSAAARRREQSCDAPAQRPEAACLCAALRRAARRLSGAYDAALAPAGVNVAQHALLTHIERRQPVSLSALGRGAGLDRSTVGRNVRVLERMGLARAVRGEDLREAVVTLTPAGAKAIADAGPLWAASQHAVEERLGPEKTQALRALLRELEREEF